MTMGQLPAQDTLFTDRPTVTFSPNTMPKGWLQVETGFQYQISDFDPSRTLNPALKTEDFLYNSTLIRYALTNFLELRLTQDLVGDRLKQNGEIINRTDASFSPTRVGVKYNFLRAKNGQILAILANYAPRFFSDTSEDYLELLFLFHSPIFKRFGFDYNIGWDFSDGLSSPRFKYSILISKSMTKRISAYAEVFGLVPKQAPNQFNYDLGLMYLINNTFQIDAYAGAGFSDFSPNFIFGFGLSKLFLPNQ